MGKNTAGGNGRTMPLEIKTQTCLIPGFVLLHLSRCVQAEHFSRLCLLCLIMRNDLGVSFLFEVKHCTLDIKWAFVLESVHCVSQPAGAAAAPVPS